MSAPTETNKTTTASSSLPESPTTARPLDLDDDDVQESGIIMMTEEKNTTGAGDAPPASAPATSASSPGAAPATSEAAPPKPPRPMTEAQKNEHILKEAFPSIEPTVIKAVLSASRGRIEPAFQALLEMTDPDAAKDIQTEEPPPQQPARPAAGSREMSQLEADELYARQLAEHYENAGAYEQRTSSREYAPRRRQQTGMRPNETDDDKEHSFLDDDLPVIRENLRKGFIETQSKVNTWITTLKKKMDEAFDEDEEARQSHLAYGRRPGEPSRRSGDYDRYDADPQVITDDFAGMKLSSDGTPMRDGRPLANPNLYKPPPPSKSPKPGDGRKVAFKETTEDIDMYQASPKLAGKDSAPSSGAKPSKWQPLSAVDPSPIADNDPFSLGDSEDEKDSKDKGSKEIKMEDSERLRKAAAEAMSESLVDPTSQGEAAGAKKS